MDTMETVKLAVDALEDKKGEDITVLDLRGLTEIADYFVIAGGSSPNQIQALIDSVDETLSKAGIKGRSIEGHKASSWVLMDFGDVVVHIFDRESRGFYDLERIWKDAKVVV